MVSRSKPAILGITESKLDKTVNDQEVAISGYKYSLLTQAGMVEMLLVLSEVMSALIEKTYWTPAFKRKGVLSFHYCQ